MRKHVAYRSDQPFLLHHLEIDRVERFEVIKEDHIELERSRHVEDLSEVAQVGGRATHHDL